MPNNWHLAMLLGSAGVQSCALASCAAQVLSHYVTPPYGFCHTSLLG